MTAISWDQVGERFYETGTDHGVLFPYDGAKKTYNKGVAWNGLTGVTSSPSGAEPSPMYADNIKYANPLSAEEYGGTIEAFTYPTEFEKCDGSFTVNGISIGQQKREQFAFSWRTKIGNDIAGSDHAYKLHIAYNALAQPSEKSYTTINDSPEAVTLSWTFTTTPLAFPVDRNPNNLKPTAYIVLDSRDVDADVLTQIENTLYGTDGSESRLLMPWELLDPTSITPAGARGAGTPESDTTEDATP